MKKRKLIFSIGLITMELFWLGICGWLATVYIIPSYRDHMAERQPTSTEALVAISGGLSDEYLKLEGLEVGEEPLEIKRTSLKFRDFVLIEPVAPEADGHQSNAIVIYSSRDKTESSISELLRQDQLEGYFNSFEMSDLRASEITALTEHFPNLNLATTDFIRYEKPLGTWTIWLCCGIFVFQNVALIYLFYSLVLKPDELRDDEDWEQKIGDDRTRVYRSSQKAMRLINQKNYADGSRQERTVDTSYDVPPIRKSTYQQNKHRVLAHIGFWANLAFMLAVPYIQNRCDFLADFGSLAGQLLIGIPLLLTAALLAKLIRGRVVIQGEESLSLDKSSYRKHGFYKYHAHVLAELDFVEIGDCKQIGTPAIVKRTIFLSPSGNLLVGLGTENDQPFFTLASLINSGKLLTTHSSTKPKYEKTDISEAHLRQSASHLDFVKALEDHDELVTRITFTGATLEAKFTADNFDRFLASTSQSKQVS